MGAVLKWLLQQSPGILAGWWGSNAVDKAGDASDAAAKFFRVIASVGTGAGTFWLLDRVIDKQSFGGGKKRDFALLVASTGVGLTTYKTAKGDASGVAGADDDIGCGEESNGIV